MTPAVPATEFWAFVVDHPYVIPAFWWLCYFGLPMAAVVIAAYVVARNWLKQ